MTSLHLLRHAKSSWGDLGTSDREWPLKPRGKRDAARMGWRWACQHAKPGRIL